MTRYDMHMGREEYQAVAAIARESGLNDIRSWMAIRPDIHHAARTVQKCAALAPDMDEGFICLREWFGVTGPDHPFANDREMWLTLTETQVMAGFCHFLKAGPAERVRTFLSACAPWIAWPREGVVWKARTEVPTKSGRIDMIVWTQLGGQSWGLAIEAKFGAKIARNPLPQYKRRASEQEFNLVFDDGPRSEARAALLVVAPDLTDEIAGRLRQNRSWQFMSWLSLFSRFERNLDPNDDDPAFAEFRKKAWECL